MGAFLHQGAPAPPSPPPLAGGQLRSAPQCCPLSPPRLPCRPAPCRRPTMRPSCSSCTTSRRAVPLPPGPLPPLCSPLALRPPRAFMQPASNPSSFSPNPGTAGGQVRRVQAEERAHVAGLHRPARHRLVPRHSAPRGGCAVLRVAPTLRVPAHAAGRTAQLSTCCSPRHPHAPVLPRPAQRRCGTACAPPSLT